MTTNKRKTGTLKPVPRPILLVEDNADDGDLIIKLLETSGLANPIEWKRDTESALTYVLENAPPVLVLLDLNFPGHMPGTLWFQRIREIPKTRYTPVVAMTHAADAMSELFRLGVVAYIMKPVTAQDLIGALWQINLKWHIGSE